MRRGVLALVPCLAGCGLLMDFDPGGEGGDASGATSSGTSPPSGIAASTGAVDPTTATAAASTSGEGGADAVSGAGGGSGGAASTPPWQSYFGGAGDQRIREIAVSPEGRVAIAGEFSLELNFGDVHETAEPDVITTFVAVYDAEGRPQWARPLSVDGFGPILDEVHVGYDEDENLYVTGSFLDQVVLGTLDDDPGGPRTFESAGSSDMFAARYDTEGRLIWANQYGDEEEQTNGGLFVGDGGNLFLVGSYCGALTLGCLDEVPVVETCETNTDIFVSQLDNDGVCLLSFAYGNEGSRDRGTSVAANGELLAIAGTHDGALAFGGAATPLATPTGGAVGAYVALLVPSGTGLDAASLGPDAKVSVLFDDDDHVRVHGSTEFTGGEGFGARDFVQGTLEDGEVEFVTKAGGASNDGGFLRVTPDGALRAYVNVYNGGEFGEEHLGTVAQGIVITTLDHDEQPAAPFDVFDSAADEAIVSAGFDARGFEIVAGNYNVDFFLDDVRIPHSKQGSDVFVARRPPPPTPPQR